jgi:hypothetical protein
MWRGSPRGRAQTWAEYPTPRLLNQSGISLAPSEGAERYLRRGSVSGTQNLTDHHTDTACTGCGGRAGAGKRESITKWLSWMADQAPNRAPAAPPRGRSGTQGTGSTGSGQVREAHAV